MLATRPTVAPALALDAWAADALASRNALVDYVAAARAEIEAALAELDAAVADVARVESDLLRLTPHIAAQHGITPPAPETPALPLTPAKAARVESRANRPSYGTCIGVLRHAKAGGNVYGPAMAVLCAAVERTMHDAGSPSRADWALATGSEQRSQAEMAAKWRWCEGGKRDHAALAQGVMLLKALVGDDGASHIVTPAQVIACFATGDTLDAAMALEADLAGPVRFL